MRKKYIYARVLVGISTLVLMWGFFSANSTSRISQTNETDGDGASNDVTTAPNKTAAPSASVTSKLFIASSTYDVLLADTPELRQKGLGGRLTLGSSEVMLFIFNEDSKHFFWMKDMLFPIDIVWLDSNQRVTHIERNVLPDTYPKSFGPETESRYVLEFKEGTANELELQVGAGVEIEL